MSREQLRRFFLVFARGEMSGLSLLVQSYLFARAMVPPTLTTLTAPSIATTAGLRVGHHITPMAFDTCTNPRSPTLEEADTGRTL
jgi:hypothetical protein